MSTLSAETKVGTFSLTTSRIVTAAVLVAITIILGVIPGVGFIPLPNGTGNATIEHIPTILGSTIEGPIVGLVTGLSFGLLSFTRATLPLFKDPLVAIFPRLLIGITPWLFFLLLKRIQLDFAAGAAGFIGAATNTFFVLLMAIMRGYLPPSIIPIVLPQAVGEAIVATVLNVILVRAVYITRNRILRAPDRKDRSKMAY
jgi:uncharacterized membrane protein